MLTDKIINTAYSFAAAVVVFGAWAKLEHKEFGSTALTVGMLVESGIFFIYGVMEWRNRKRSAEAPELQSQPPVKMTDPNELTKTMERTNSILTKIFRAE
ncbi:MAG TPA: hypothetical protein VL978_12580 [Puia sp.]|nr:hypothetical protein [Puia sp.]